MLSSFGRTAASLILAPCIAFSAILAPEHAHEADADHPHTTVHRHAQPHAVGPHHHDDDHDHARLADSDGLVVWMDNATLQQLPYQCLAPVAPPVDRFEPAPPIAVRGAKPDYNAAPPHGPPRACLSLRAPPSCLSA